MRKRWLVSLAAFSLFLLAACGGGSSTDTTDGGATDTTDGGTTETTNTTTGNGGELQEVVVLSPLGDHIAFTPLYIARELGFFEEEGLDVRVEGASGSSQVLQLLVAGQGDIGLPGAEAFMGAADQGADVVTFYNFYQKPIFGLVVPTDSDIETVDDLRGRVIGVTELSGGEVPVIAGLLRDAGMEFGADAEVVPVGDEVPAIANALDSGSIDAFGGSASDFAALGAAGIEVREITTERTAAFPGGGQVTTGQLLAENPDLLAAFGRAWAKATHAWAVVPEVAEAATRVQLPEFWEDPESGRFQLEARWKIYELPEGKLHGINDIAAYEAYAEYLRAEIPGREPLLSGTFDPSESVTNELVEQFNDFDPAAVEQAARDYLGN